MIQRVPTKSLITVVSLIFLSLILPYGCNGKSLAERNNAVMETLEKQGVGDPANRDKYSSEEYREGYDAGYKNGYNEGKGDYSRGEDFTPSAMGVRTGNAKYDEGFRVGNLDGYYDAYEDCIRIDEEAEQVAASGDESGREVADTSNDYNEGYEMGYNLGFRDGSDDKKYGFEYSPTPVNKPNFLGSEVFKRGLEDGYEKGYEKGYNGT